MLRSVSLAITLGIALCGNGQHWAVGVGGLSNDAFTDLVVDGTGNTYVTGEFGTVIQLGATTMTTYGSLDAVVAKFNGEGDMLWCTHFGGSGLDRGIALALGAGGELVVVGQYMGTASFGTSSLTASGATPDGFTASLNATSGAVNWVRSSGGPDWVDQPTGVSVGADGTIAITGEFRGTAQIGSQSFTSTVDPLTGEPSVDIYIQTYAADGTDGWSKHGAAAYADRGMDVAHDPSGDIIVTGQFSDTLSLGGVVHTNAMYSAVFIVRYAPNGTEEWFRIFGGGTYNQVFDVLVTDVGRIFLCGDVQGTVIYQDSVPDIFTAVAPRSSFLLEVSPTGELVQRTTWGSAYEQSTRSLSVFDDEVAVLGRFVCHHTGFSAVYGDGVFLATGEYDLYIARFDLEGFGFKDAQQFGGTGTKAIGAMQHDPDGELLFCGAFQSFLNFPTHQSGFMIVPVNDEWLGMNAPAGYCQDPNYPYYTPLFADALKDAFVARGLVGDRQPYDFFLREGSTCDRSIPTMHINANWQVGVFGTDSMEVCDSTTLFVHTGTTFTYNGGAHTSPDFDFAWSTGDTIPEIEVFTTGWYHVELTSRAGCLVGSDSVHITVHNSPEVPLINDDQGVNTNALEAEDVIVCAPTEPWLWVTNVAAGDGVWWEAQPAGANDSIHATQSGRYDVIVTDMHGCQSRNLVDVWIYPNEPLPPMDVQYEITFPQDTDQNDTIVICPESMAYGRAAPTFLLNGVPVQLPYGLRLLRRCDGVTWVDVEPNLNNDYIADCHSWPAVPSWQVFEIELLITNAPCGEDSLFFTQQDSIYVIPDPVADPVVFLTGPSILCPGDTALLQLTCINCDSVQFGGPFLSTDPNLLLGASAGYYTVHAYRTSVYGCTVQSPSQHVINAYPRPHLGSEPSDAIICPNDTALIVSDTPGLSYQWYGPMGPIATQNDSISVTQPGEYYLELVDLTGCAVNSDPILLTDYATPFLNVSPDGVLCETGETAELQVVTTSTASLQWASPLSGGALTQLVSQPGTYTCSVSACDIVTELSTVIFGAQAVANIQGEDTLAMCEGNGLELEAVIGQAFYLWEPGQGVGPTYNVTQPGTYHLITSDPLGCSDTASVVVELIPWTEAMVTSDTAVCTGTPVVLQVPGSGLITWYADQGMNQILGTGNTLDLGTPAQSMTVYAQQVEGACTSALRAVEVSVFPYPQAPVILGPDTACAGLPVALSVNASPNETYTWTTPQGTFTGPIWNLDPAVESASGNYVVEASNPGCAVTGDVHTLVVLSIIPVDIAPDTTICPGGVAVFSIGPDHSAPVWQDGSTAPSFATTTAEQVVVHAVDMNGCPVTDTALVVVYAFVQMLEAPDVNICLGSDANMIATGSGQVTWFNDPSLLNVVSLVPSWTVEQPQASATYYVVQTEGQCTNGPEAMELVVTPPPTNVTLVGPASLCAGEELVMELQGTSVNGGQWSMPTGQYSGTSLTVAEVGVAFEGTYVVVPYNGACPGDSTFTQIDILIPQPPDIGPDTTFCEGGAHLLVVPQGYNQVSWSTGASGMELVVTEPGTYGVEAIDPQGCAVHAEVNLIMIHCDPFLPNVITPNGDGVNDSWALENGPYKTADLQVFNRFGTLVWQADPSHLAFDGVHQMSHDPLTAGVYFYVLHLDAYDGEAREEKGYLQILR